ncbi:dihydrofolate reductase family protein [Nocardia sp. alder85J]|uniref:dihydrofolate reductase family protein n=1 Tax=Nocardia sp. alder85J TaxID=2862949 RepID=UPI001CD1F5CA|nr:dihydrofolate reductase family protein [Nocardia sp. alder85J]MCX4095954.1 dihydrofolate reductase family protein [Nocardia sp. alder85J]
MRTLCAAAFLSFDGVAESPTDWMGPYLTPAIDEELLDLLDEAEAFLFGRNTFQEMAATWQRRSGPMADLYNVRPKYVVSTTLGHPGWRNARTLGDPATDRVAELKADGEGLLLVIGSPELVRRLTAAGLVDEYRFLMAPLILGKGKRLFPDGIRVPLTLIDAKIYESGVTQLRYAPTRS